MTGQENHLSERAESILRHVVHNYITTAVPVGSRFISKKSDKHLSPATIRNVMADLEELGYLSHPHTSAGRVPTDLGYRYYVDYLMEVERLSDQERAMIDQQLEIAPDPTEMLRETSRLLGKISRQLGIVSSPHISSGILEKLEIIPISSSKLLVVMSIRSGLVRTLMLEVGTDIRQEKLDEISRMLNERLTGLTLREIRDTFVERVRDQSEQTGLVRLFIDSVDLLFSDDKAEKVHISGTQNIIEQPEFVDSRSFRSVIELIENEEMIVHLLERHDQPDKDVMISIGTENEESKADVYSVVTGRYETEGIVGQVGIIGPKRMNYARLIPLVDHVARTIARLLCA